MFIFYRMRMEGRCEAGPIPGELSTLRTDNTVTSLLSSLFSCHIICRLTNNYCNN